ncbi:MAG: hypothetical protein ABSG99_09485 [Sedimentisphaerales bacterium]
MSSKSFSYSGALGFGWSVVKSNFWFFVGVWVVSFFVSFFVSLPGQILGQLAGRSPKSMSPFLAPVAVITSYIMQVILGIGLIKITLSFCDGVKPRFSTLFNAWGCFWRYIGAGLLYALIIGGASIACVLLFILLSTVTHSPYFILPVLIAFLILVVILSIKFCLCCYFVIDKGLGPINALKASSMATAGAIDSLAVFSILCCLINMLGVLCFFVGLFATIPTVMVAMALVYRQLSAQTPELAELGISGSNVEPRASVGVTGGIQPVAGMRSDPVIRSGLGIRLGQGVQLSPGFQPIQGVQPSEGIRADSAKAALAATAGPAPAIQREGGKKSDNSLLFWIAVLIMLSVALAAGIGHRLWPRLKGKIVVPPKDVVVSPKEVAVSPKQAVASPKEVALKGILYSEDKPSALIGDAIVTEGDIIDGVKVVKIHRDSVEFEKDGEKWTQRTE